MCAPRYNLSQTQTVLFAVMALCLMGTASATKSAIPLSEPQLTQGQTEGVPPVLVPEPVRNAERAQMAPSRCPNVPNLDKLWKDTRSCFKGCPGCPAKTRIRISLQDILNPTRGDKGYLGERMYNWLWMLRELRMKLFYCPFRCCTMTSKAMKMIGKYYGYRNCCQNDFLECRRKRRKTSGLKCARGCCKCVCICLGRKRVPHYERFNSTIEIKRELLRACTYNYDRRLGHVPHLCDRCCDGILKRIRDEDWEFETRAITWPKATEACIVRIREAIEGYEATLPKRRYKLDKRPDGQGGFVSFSEDRMKMNVLPMVFSYRFLYYCGNNPGDRLNLKELRWLLKEFRDFTPVYYWMSAAETKEILDHCQPEDHTKSYHDWEGFRKSLPKLIAEGKETPAWAAMKRRREAWWWPWCPEFVRNWL